MLNERPRSARASLTLPEAMMERMRLEEMVAPRAMSGWQAWTEKLRSRPI